MRLNKRELSERLGISETSLTEWQKKGLPVLEHGSRGKPGVYDLAAVVRWVRETGSGLAVRGSAPRIDLVRLERELGVNASPAPPDLCLQIARAITRARADWLQDFPTWEDPIAVNDAIELIGRYTYALTCQLERVGLGDVAGILELVESIDAWPADFNQALARAKAEIP